MVGMKDILPALSRAGKLEILMDLHLAELSAAKMEF
jgi:hypothetical protein